jgi:predicted phage-related endonuclease
MPAGKMYFDIQQSTPEWHAMRLGRVTASRIADVLATTKSGWASSRGNYAAELVVERLTGKTPERFKSAAMDFGSETEEAARNQYLYDNDFELLAKRPAFVEHPFIPMAGCSPDLLIGDDGGAEFKAPLPATHIETLKGKNIPGNYLKQIYWQMACCDLQWIDFTSYCADLPPEMRRFSQRITRNQAVITQYEAEVQTFLQEVEASVIALRNMYPAKEAA